jgi:hypothetical protein
MSTVIGKIPYIILSVLLPHRLNVKLVEQTARELFQPLQEPEMSPYLKAHTQKSVPYSVIMSGEAFHDVVG